MGIDSVVFEKKTSIYAKSSKRRKIVTRRAAYSHSQLYIITLHRSDYVRSSYPTKGTVKLI